MSIAMKNLSNRRLRPHLLAAAAGVACTVGATSAHAQSAWAAAVSDSWLNAARWTPAGVPNAAGTNVTIGVAGTYTVSLQNANVSCGTLTVSNANATLNPIDNAALFVAGNISNSGLIQISTPASPGNGTRLDLLGPITVSGNGTLRLAAAGGNGDSDAAYLYNNAVGTNTLTNSAGHTIAGYGRVYTGIINNGTVNGDVNGKGLFFIQQPLTNNATVTASNGGFMQFRGVAVNQGSSGVCVSTNSSPVQFVNASASGGTLDGAGTSSGIQYFGTNSLNGVTLTNLNAINDNSSVHIGAAGVVNNGTWTVSSPGAPGNGTHIDADTPTSVTGTGTIRLQAAGSNGDSNSAYLYHNTNGANTLANGPAHSIKGYGRIYVGLINNGTVNADVSGKGLFFIEQPATNNGTMTASNGGFLQFRGVTVTGNPAAQIISSDAASPVQMVNATMSGGGFTTSGTGVFQYYQSNTLSNLTVNGTHQITDNSRAILATNLVNNGSWFINTPTAPGNSTRLDAGASVTISGTGTIRLQGNQSGIGDNDSAYLYNNANSANILTLGANQQLLGYGRVYVGLINNGTITADNPTLPGPANRGIFFIDQPKTNNGTITATNGGFVQFRGVTVTGNPAAQIISTDAASPVQMVNATMSGGGFTTSGTGVFQYYQSNTLSNLTVNGTHQITDNSRAILATNLVNNGSWFINTPTAPGNSTRLDAGASVTISGTGTIRLQGNQSGIGDNDSAYLYNNANSANILTLGANQQLLGYGRVYVGLINNGTINADNSPNAAGPASKGIFLMSEPKTNNATITSSNGGFWYVRGITLTNNGTLSSSNTTTSGGGFENCTISGGSLTNVSNQFFGTAGTATLDGVTITPGSGVQVNDNSTLNLGTGGITNNGTILVETLGAPGNTSRILTGVPATISGTGTVRLQATGFNNNSAYLWGNGATLTLGAGQTLTGTGRLFGTVVLNGTISPDQPFGTPTIYGSIQPQNNVTFGAGCTYNVQISPTPATTGYDSMQGSAAIAINGGTLNIAFQPGYVPNSGDQFDVIVGGGGVTGKFTTVNITGLGSYVGGPARVVYMADRVRVVMCYANADGSNVVPTLTAADFTAFLASFRAGDSFANCDGSTSVPTLTAADFTCFLTKFRTGCN